jgi:hypothetical protein
MNLKQWRIVQRFCRGRVFDPAAFGAFAQLVEEDQESAVREKVRHWRDEELEQLSFLISGTLDTVDDPQKHNGVLQCQGLYLTGSESSLVALGKREIPKEVRSEMAKSLSQSLPEQTRIIIGSHIVPATWVHGFSWKQWRRALARDEAMFSRPCKAQPRQVPESQAWILPVFVEKRDLLAELETDVSVAGVSELSRALADLLAGFFSKTTDAWPSDVALHPILAAAHACWANAKMIAVYQWAKTIQSCAQAEGRAILIEERPHRGAVQVRDARTRRIIAAMKPDASFPVDGTRMAIQMIVNDDSPA